MLSLIFGTRRTPNKYSFIIVDLFKGLHIGTRLGKCVFALSVCNFFYWLWVISPPGAGGGGEGVGLCETLFCEPLWELSSRHNISCHHATLVDVQATFPSLTLVVGIKGEENGSLLLPPSLLHVRLSGLCYISSLQLHGVGKWYSHLCFPGKGTKPLRVK